LTFISFLPVRSVISITGRRHAMPAGAGRARLTGVCASFDGPVLSQPEQTDERRPQRHLVPRPEYEIVRRPLPAGRTRRAIRTARVQHEGRRAAPAGIP